MTCFRSILIPRFQFLLLTLVLFSSCKEEDYSIPYFQEKVKIDGSQRDSIWRHCEPIGLKYSPWENTSIALTEFKHFYDDQYLYFHFATKDKKIICYEHFQNKVAVEYSDKVEIFFSTDYEMNNYYGLEIDACGRVISFKSTGYRNFEKNWKFPNLKERDIKVISTKQGYEVEGRVSIAVLNELGIIKGKEILIGIFRADFKKENNRDKVQWLSWKEITTKKPDFHTIEGFRLLNFGDKH